MAFVTDKGEIKQQTPEAGGRKFIKTDPETISELLRQRGIPGIKYFDAGSRDKMAGTRNFVVFPGEEKSLNILSKK
jgi:predicted Rdx family selenoprotein